MTFTHDEIDAQDLLDRYVRRQLDAATSDAVEEHYFGCDICFAKVTELEALRGAVRQAVDAGTLTDETPALAPIASTPAPARRSSRIIVWSMAASVALALLSGWAVLVRMPALQQQLQQSEQERATLATDLAQVRAAAIAARPAAPVTESNFGLLMLSSERGLDDVPSYSPSTTAPRLAIAIDGPQSPSGTGKITVTGPGATPATVTIDKLVRGANGLWTINLMVREWPRGLYRARLYDSAPNGALLGEYQFRISGQ